MGASIYTHVHIQYKSSLQLWEVPKFDSETTQAPTFTSSLRKGSINCPWRSPFFSKNTTSCWLGLSCVDAIKLPEGLKANRVLEGLQVHAAGFK